MLRRESVRHGPRGAPRGLSPGVLAAGAANPGHKPLGLYATVVTKGPRERSGHGSSGRLGWPCRDADRWKPVSRVGHTRRTSPDGVRSQRGRADRFSWLSHGVIKSGACLGDMDTWRWLRPSSLAPAHGDSGCLPPPLAEDSGSRPIGPMHRTRPSDAPLGCGDGRPWRQERETQESHGSTRSGHRRNDNGSPPGSMPRGRRDEDPSRNGEEAGGQRASATLDGLAEGEHSGGSCIGEDASDGSREAGCPGRGNPVNLRIGGRLQHAGRPVGGASRRGGNRTARTEQDAGHGVACPNRHFGGGGVDTDRRCRWRGEWPLGGKREAMLPPGCEGGPAGGSAGRRRATR